MTVISSVLATDPPVKVCTSDGAVVVAFAFSVSLVVSTESISIGSLNVKMRTLESRSSV